MNHLGIPQPVVRELTGDTAWQAWDEAVQEQDTGFLSLEETEQDKMRETLRSKFRRESK